VRGLVVNPNARSSNPNAVIIGQSYCGDSWTLVA